MKMRNNAIDIDKKWKKVETWEDGGLSGMRKL